MNLPTPEEMYAARKGQPISKLGVKGQPAIVEKREKKSALDAKDRAEREKCHIRSGGRCEVIEVIAKPEQSAIVKPRCKRKAVHNHHLISGNGKRNIGPSILAEHRLDTCQRCHQDIEAELLIPADRDKREDAATVTYERSTS